MGEGDAPAVVASGARRDRRRVHDRADWEHEALKAALETVAARHELKLGKAQAPIRVAVTGRSVGPPLFESLEVLGRDETIKRLDAAVARLPRD